MKEQLKKCIPECIALLIISVGLSINVFASLDKPKTIVPVVFLITMALTVLCSRNRYVFVAFTIFGFIVNGAFAYLEYEISTLAYLAVGAGFVFENLILALKKGKDDSNFGDFRTKSATIQSGLIALVIVAISFGVFTVVIKPLNPPTKDIRLTTKLMSFEILEKIGVSRYVDVPSDQVDNTQKTDSDKSGELKDDLEDQKTEEENQSKTNYLPNINKLKPIAAELISYDLPKQKKSTLFFKIAVALLLPVFIKLCFRLARVKKIQSLEGGAVVVYLYNYFLKSYSRIGLKRIETYTLEEYALENTDKLRKLEKQREGRFVDLTKIYEKTVYGGIEPTKDEENMFRDYYTAFHKNVKDYLGIPKAMIKFWVL